MLELWSRATTIATPCPAILVTPPTVCGRASATARAADRQSAQQGRQLAQPDPTDASLERETLETGPGDPRPCSFQQPGKRHEDHEPEPSGLSKSHHMHLAAEVERLSNEFQPPRPATKASRAASARWSAVSGSRSSTVRWPIFRPGTADCFP